MFSDYLSAKVMDKLNNAAMLLNAMIRDVLINKCELEKRKHSNDNNANSKVYL